MIYTIKFIGIIIGLNSVIIYQTLPEKFVTQAISITMANM